MDESLSTHHTAVTTACTQATWIPEILTQLFNCQGRQKTVGAEELWPEPWLDVLQNREADQICRTNLHTSIFVTLQFWLIKSLIQSQLLRLYMQMQVSRKCFRTTSPKMNILPLYISIYTAAIRWDLEKRGHKMHVFVTLMYVCLYTVMNSSKATYCITQLIVNIRRHWGHVCDHPQKGQAFT